MSDELKSSSSSLGIAAIVVDEAAVYGAARIQAGGCEHGDGEGVQVRADRDCKS
jgi:hypothetical protein